MTYEIETELDRYVDNHISREPDHLRQLTRESYLHLGNGRLCSGHLQGRLLKMLTALCSPKTVVELGTFTGYSALCISASPHGDKIELRIGDALEECRSMADDSVDMMFIDADKRQYPAYLEEAVRITRPGGLIIADNTLWSGHVCEDAYRDDPQTSAIRRFNETAATHPALECVILPFRDGITLLRKKS